MRAEPRARLARMVRPDLGPAPVNVFMSTSTQLDHLGKPRLSKPTAKSFLSISMPQLTDLPAELFREICFHICLNQHENGHHNLSRLSRTCTQLRNIIQPLVFTAFVHRQSSRDQLIQLLRSLTHRPDLAQHLKYLCIDQADAETPLSTPDLDLVKTTLAKLNLPTNHPHEFTYSSFNQLPIIELILLHTPNLTHLTIPVNHEWEFLFLPNYASQTQNPPLLPRLHTFQANHH